VTYWLHVLIHFEILAFVALPLGLMVMTGLLNAGVAAFYGVGATAFALLALKHGWSFASSAAGAALVTGGLSVAFAFAARKLRRDAFVLATMAAQVTIFAVLYNWTGLTGGPFGLYGIPKPSILGHQMHDATSIALMYGALLGLLALVVHALMHSGFGRNLEAIRNDEAAARSLGIPVERMKIFATVFATAMVGVAGAMYASYGSYIDPTLFSLDESILMLSAVIVGGAGRMRGPLAGAAIIIALPELLRELDISSDTIASLRVLIFGLLLVVMMRVRPQGLFGKYRME